MTENRRPLFDNSNELFLENSINQNESFSRSNASRAPTWANNECRHDNRNIDDSDEEDALLTQALNKHQETTARSQSQVTPPTDLSPPAKKMKSLAQTLFESDETDNVQEPRTSVGKGRISLATLLEDGDTEESDEDDDRTAVCAGNLVNDNRHATSIYIEETDSE